MNGFAGERATGKTARFANREAVQNWNSASYRTLAYADNIQVLPVPQVEQFVGVPVAQVANFAALSPLPATIQYLYPDTSDYYYRYGDGYLYQVDRGTSLIDALIPLIAGGFLPGQYLPNSYMNSYVPGYYGFNSFYPDYGNVCNRYYQGVVYGDWSFAAAAGLVKGVVSLALVLGANKVAHVFGESGVYKRA